MDATTLITKVQEFLEKTYYDQILERIRKGEDFENLARQYSEDPSALKGGDIGFFSRGELKGQEVYEDDGHGVI